MPIQFRCPACDRMLGIARRKAGTVVKCPRCAAEVQVPALAGMAIETNGPVGAAPAIPKNQQGERRSSATSPSPKKTSRDHTTERLDALPLFERPDFETLLNPAISESRPQPVEVPEAATPTKTLSNLTIDEGSSISVEPLDNSIVLSRQTFTIALVIVICLIGFAFLCGYFIAGFMGTGKS